MKTDIQKLGKDKKTGVNMYAYRYRGDPKTYPKSVGPTVLAKEYPSEPSPRHAAANPFNRQMGSDVSYGEPLQAPIPAPPLDRAGELRAAMGGPITDRAVSAFQAYAPSILGGTG